jgi:IS5 family transposase
MSGQIVDATMIQARRRRLTRDEKATLKGGAVPTGWSKAKRAQMDTDGRWTLKRGRRRPVDPGKPHEPTRIELVIPVLGYKNQLGIDRRHVHPQLHRHRCRQPRRPPARLAARSA